VRRSQFSRLCTTSVHSESAFARRVPAPRFGNVGDSEPHRGWRLPQRGSQAAGARSRPRALRCALAAGRPGARARRL